MTCKSCRLNKCLIAGMDPDLVTVPISNEHEQFLKGIEKRRKTLAMDLCEKPDEKEMRQVDGNEPTGDNNDDDDDGMETVCFLVSIIRCFGICTPSRLSIGLGAYVLTILGQSLL